MTTPTPAPVPIYPPAGTGYWRPFARRFADVELVTLLPLQTLPVGQTIGPIVEVGERHAARLALEVRAKATSTNLAVTIQTSMDGSTAWRTCDTAFHALTDVGLAMSAVGSAGTTPPTLSLTGTATREVNLRVEATDISGGAGRGSWVGRYSLDGGVSWVAFTSAATVVLLDEYGVASGLTLGIGSGNAATDNVWTARTAGFERKSVGSFDRFIRAVAVVTTDTVDATLYGELT